MLQEDLKKLKENVKEALYFDINAPFEEGYNPWIIEPLVPLESITVLDGLGGSGKSWFALNLAYSIGLEKDFLGMFPVRKNGTVLYLTAEETPPVFFQRLKAIRKHYPENMNFAWISLLHKKLNLSPYICRRKRGEQVVTATAEILEYLIDETKPILVVLDSLVNFYGLKENDSEDASFFYDVLKYLMRKYGTGFLLLHHQNKEGMRIQSDDVISFRGSSVFREQARSRIIYKNLKITEKLIARKIILEKFNFYSKLIEDLKLEDGIYLKFEGGIHKYDKAFELEAKKAEEEAKNKNKKQGKSKKKQEKIEDDDIPF